MEKNSLECFSSTYFMSAKDESFTICLYKVQAGAFIMCFTVFQINMLVVIQKIFTDRFFVNCKKSADFINFLVAISNFLYCERQRKLGVLLEGTLRDVDWQFIYPAGVWFQSFSKYSTCYRIFTSNRPRPRLVYRIIWY